MRGGGRQDVEVEFFAAAGPIAPVEISFARAPGPFAYAPALVEDRLRELDLTAAAFEEYWIAAPSGLVRLGPGRYLVKHCRVGHLALGVARHDDRVRLRLERPGLRRYRFRFSVLEGDEAAALTLARRINTHPIVVR